MCQIISFASTAKLRSLPRVGGWDISLDSIEFVQTPETPLEEAMGMGSIHPPTPSHEVDNQPPQSMGEMNCMVETFNKSAISRESAYVHFGKKRNNKIRAVD